MNSENDIRKEFNDVFEPKTEVPVEPYHATNNLTNETVTTESNQVLNLNIQNNNNQNIIMPEYASQNISSNANIANNLNSQNIEKDTPVLYDTTNYINDKPIVQKTKKATVKINPELKTAILLVIILLVAMAFIPTIFDLLDKLKISVFR